MKDCIPMNSMSTFLFEYLPARSSRGVQKLLYKARSGQPKEEKEGLSVRQRPKAAPANRCVSVGSMVTRAPRKHSNPEQDREPKISSA